MWYGKTPLRRKRHRNADADEVFFYFPFFNSSIYHIVLFSNYICFVPVTMSISPFFLVIYFPIPLLALVILRKLFVAETSKAYNIG